MLPQPKGTLRLPETGRRSARKLRDKSRFPAKRHNESDGLHRRSVTIVPSFQQEIMRMLSDSLLVFMIPV